MPWSVYIIQCNNTALYTGIALDVHKRFNEHNAQGAKCAKFLRGKTPLTLLFHQVIGSKSDALKIERKIKALSRKQKLAIIKSGVI